jgi:hypothetical protein
LFPTANKLTSPKQDVALTGKAEIGLVFGVNAANWFATKPCKSTRKESTVRRKRWIRAFVLTLTAALPVVRTLTSTSVAIAVDDSVERLANVVASKNTSDDERADAAAQLVKSDAPDARAAVRFCLQNSGKPLGQAAFRAGGYCQSVVTIQ